MEILVFLKSPTCPRVKSKSLPSRKVPFSRVLHTQPVLFQGCFLSLLLLNLSGDSLGASFVCMYPLSTSPSFCRSLYIRAPLLSAISSLLNVPIECLLLYGKPPFLFEWDIFLAFRGALTMTWMVCTLLWICLKLVPCYFRRHSTVCLDHGCVSAAVILRRARAFLYQDLFCFSGRAGHRERWIPTISSLYDWALLIYTASFKIDTNGSCRFSMLVALQAKNFHHLNVDNHSVG